MIHTSEYCAQPLGMQNRTTNDNTIPDENIVASTGSGKARLNEDVWFPDLNDHNPQITISFDQHINIASFHIR